MIDSLLGLLSGVFGWLASVLPSDPFAQWVQVTDGMRLGLGWLNWFFPVGDALAFFSVWLGLMVAWRVAQTLILRTVGVIGSATGS